MAEGIIIDVKDHNMLTERARVSTLTSMVDKDIAKLSEELNDLTNYWKDEKSAGMISELTAALDEVKTANESAKTATQEYLEEIGKILKMNYTE